MINKKEHQFEGIIWKIHYDPVFDELFIETREDDKGFSLWQLNTPHALIYKIPIQEEYISKILCKKGPILLIQYYPKDQLHSARFIQAFDLNTSTVLWSSSNISVDEIYLNELRVMQSNIMPPRIYYIDYNNNVVSTPSLQEIPIPYTFAIQDENQHSLKLADYTVSLAISDELTLQVLKSNDVLYEEVISSNEAEYNKDYDYLIAFHSNEFILLSSKSNLCHYRIINDNIL